MKNIRQCYFGEDRVRKVIINSFRGAIFFQRGRHVLDQQIKSNVNVYNLIFLYYNAKNFHSSITRNLDLFKKKKKKKVTLILIILIKSTRSIFLITRNQS